ncbi:MAG TPA: hypothetical protein HPQ00_17590, partial [Magnetococcales bacterium]|nr:hypothetical protein [Magnetococcales bacterium]
IRGGKLRGLLEIRDDVIHGKKGFLTRLEAITDELRWQVNRVHSQSVNPSMAKSLQGSISLGRDLETAIKDVVTNEKNKAYQKAPVDLSRVVNGTITFASGDSTDALTVSKPVTITSDMSIRQIKEAIDASDAVDAEFVTEGDKRYLKITPAKKGGVFGVLKDTSGILAALGLGGMFSGSGAETIQVGKSLLADSKLVGMARFGVDNETSPTKATFDDGNSQGAIALGNLRTTKFKIDDQTASLTSHYATLTGNLGSLINQDKESLVAQKSAQDFIGTMRESISGVSLEEELTDLIRYQRAFQASSKMVNVADELLQTLISMV